MATPKTQPLDERIRAIQAEASAAIDQFVEDGMEALRKGSNTGECGIPAGVIRMQYVKGEDVCSAYLRLKRERDEQAAREKAA